MTVLHVPLARQSSATVAFLSNLRLLRGRGVQVQCHPVCPVPVGAPDMVRAAGLSGHLSRKIPVAGPSPPPPPIGRPEKEGRLHTPPSRFKGQTRITATVKAANPPSLTMTGSHLLPAVHSHTFPGYCWHSMRVHADANAVPVELGWHFFRVEKGFGVCRGGLTCPAIKPSSPCDLWCCFLFNCHNVVS